MIVPLVAGCMTILLKHTIFCIQELLVCREITLYFAFIWASVPENQDKVKRAVYSAENLSKSNLGRENLS